MSQSKLNTTSVPAPATQAPPPPLRQPGTTAPEASRDQVLSWEAAMGRAQQGLAPPHAGPRSPGEPAEGADAEWSPMNPNGTRTGGEASAMAVAREPDGAGATARDLVGADAQLPGMPGEPPGRMSPEELLQRQRDRVAMGLEGDGAPLAEGCDDPQALLDGLPSQTGSGMAQPVTLAQPVAMGWQSLPVSERPVTDGMTTEELVTERHVERERSDDQAYEANGEVAAEQARLTEANTPDTLPERTIESV